MTIERLPQIKGAVFDVDDTLLDNQHPEVGPLHERSRFEAVMHIADKYKIDSLKTLTHEENTEAFMNATVHSLAGAVWEILCQKGIATGDIDLSHPLLCAIVELKNELHADVLRKHGKAVLGAVELVDHLVAHDAIAAKMAVASSAYRRDIDIFFDELYPDLRQFFPADRIVAYEDIPHGQGKPHPEPFDRAFRLLRLPDAERQNVIAFEDDPRGVQSAKAAGLYVCAITTRFSRDNPALVGAGPDMIVDRYAEFIERYAS